MSTDNRNPFDPPESPDTPPRPFRFSLMPSSSDRLFSLTPSERLRSRIWARPGDFQDKPCAARRRRERSEQATPWLPGAGSGEGSATD